MEAERRILLELGNDITKVRNKTDLITVLSNKIREMFTFSHSIVTLINPDHPSYTPFLLDPNLPHPGA